MSGSAPTRRAHGKMADLAALAQQAVPAQRAITVMDPLLPAPRSAVVVTRAAAECGDLESPQVGELSPLRAYLRDLGAGGAPRGE